MRPAPPTLVATRRTAQAIAEWILAPARYAATGRIGLRHTPGGFGTPPLPDGRVVRVDGVTLVDEGPDDVRAVHPLTTLGQLAVAVGVTPGQSTGIYEPVTAWDADAPLDVDADAVAVLAEWFAFATELLDELRQESVDGAPVQLWPEHFDMATVVGDERHRANLGASPGDDDHPLPYLYVGPWNAVDGSNPFWNEPFGASLGYDALLGEADQRAAALAFLRSGRHHA